jgi:hypothetical protein
VAHKAAWVQIPPPAVLDTSVYMRLRQLLRCCGPALSGLGLFKRKLHALHRDVCNYYRRVEPQSFVQEITDRAPYLRRELEQWQRQHQLLMQELERTCRQIRRQRNHLADNKSRLQQLLRAILQHEAERDQLVYRSFYPEPAALD